MRTLACDVKSLGARLPVVLSSLAPSKPDVACLQELKTTGETFPARGHPRGRRSAKREESVT